MALRSHGNDGSESISIVARSRIRLAVGASSGEKLSMSKETIKLSPKQFAGGKKCSLSYVVFMVPGELAPSPMLATPKVCDARRL